MFTYRFESLQKWVWLRCGRGLTRKRLNRWFDLLLNYPFDVKHNNRECWPVQFFL